ncbi:putative F-box protein PP2-B12 isoform X2 [Durio zibethinus]|uniref:F-box protein PP2-B12 isoform X2 n=1 Tax=Durio zibethinus TaxID=66656 RepID=A0A6P5X5Z3_DURZI|nr:putative F-box protein PP2-B12 isoform X2 [Durio zibethinus]
MSDPKFRRTMDFTKLLPEECMCLIISLTSPRDACRSALVSPALRPVADSDDVWERFLPCDYQEIISRYSSTSLLSWAKKRLYFHLSFHPILIENGTMSFQLEKETGKKCYMLGARALSIIWGDTPQYWTWTSLPESRFSEVAELRIVWWLDVKGRIETRNLSSGTNYAAYLVFKLNGSRYGFRERTVGLHVNVGETASGEVRSVFLDHPQNDPQQAQERGDGWMEIETGEFFNECGDDGFLDHPQNDPQQAQKRGDGWMEIEMGEFFNECGDDGTVEFCLREIDCNYDKRGLIIEGIEVRPKNIGR